jgi:uncharacterized membrane protein YfcA
MILLEMLTPEGLSSTAIGFVILAAFFTSALTAAIGLGGGVLMVGLMSLVFPAAAIIPVHGVVQLGSNISRTALFIRHLEWRLLGLFLFGAVFGAFIGASVYIGLSVEVIRLLLGLFILFTTWAPKLQGRELPKPVFVLIGALACFISMFVGAAGPFVGAMLPTNRLSKQSLIGTLGGCMTILHTLKIIAFGFFGFAFAHWIPFLACAMTAGFFGAMAGKKIAGLIPDQSFKKIFRIVLTLLAIYLIWLSIPALLN